MWSKLVSGGLIMLSYNKKLITSVKAYEILNSRNDPAVACRMKSSGGKSVVFKVPSGASTGEKEMVELLDGGKRYRGKGVLKAVSNVNNILAPLIEGRKSLDMSQKEFDRFIREKDKTDNMGELGGNAILSVSGAFAMLRAESNGLELWQHFAGSNVYMPVPQINVLNAGKHADSGFEVQETLILPVGAESFAHAMEIGTDVWHSLKGLLKGKDKSTGRGDEGGFVNPFTSLDATADNVIEAVERAHYSYGKQVMLAFDPAFSEVFGKDLWDKVADQNDKTYHLRTGKYSPQDMAAFWAEKAVKYKIISLEDAMAQTDTEGWGLLTKEIGKTTQLVLDDYICTNPEIIMGAIRDGVGNASLIKVNQIGTISGTIDAMQAGKTDGRSNIISHRSGETEADFIAHLAMHPLADQIKTGSSGGERNAKYNTLIMIEQDLGSKAVYRGFAAFPESVREYWSQKQ